MNSSTSTAAYPTSRNIVNIGTAVPQQHRPRKLAGLSINNGHHTKLMKKNELISKSICIEDHQSAESLTKRFKGGKGTAAIGGIFN